MELRIFRTIEYEGIIQQLYDIPVKEMFQYEYIDDAMKVIRFIDVNKPAVPVIRHQYNTINDASDNEDDEQEDEYQVNKDEMKEEYNDFDYDIF